MQIITTVTLEVSDANLALIPMIIAKNGGKISEDETDRDAIIRIRNSAEFMTLLGQIKPHVESYFGEMHQDQANSIVESLYNGAIITDTVIMV